jgi:hypothetical protein
MRKLVAILGVVALLAACGTDAATTTSTSEPPAATKTDPPAGAATTADTAAPSTTGTIASTTTAPAVTTTVSPSETTFTVEEYGQDVDAVLTSSGALGSGCAPGTDALADGVWFGWATDFGADAIEFDLACLWPGRAEPAASNDAARLRTVPVPADALLYTLTGNPVSYDQWDGEQATFDNARGLPDVPPLWVFINNGVATEFLEYPVPIYWAKSATAWPELVPGCCDAGDVAPASPTDPWPDEGWPADGFYHIWVDGRSRAAIEITMRKFLSCADYPEMCPDWWTEENVTIDLEATALERILRSSPDLTVVILPITSEVPIVGNGQAFRTLLDDVDGAIEYWINSPETSVPWAQMQELATDPDFPFGFPDTADEFGYPIGFRGPGGALLTYADDPSYLFGWPVMEIRDGKPILYIHAGIIAG